MHSQHRSGGVSAASCQSLPEPWKTKVVEPIRLVDSKSRERILEQAGLNVFNIRAEDVFIDLLTDSGTGAMSEHQWAAMMQADESYAGSPSFERLRDSIKDVMGFPFVLPTHQGRGAENVLHSALVKPGDIVIGNSLFDTTKAHIEMRHGRGIDCTVDECFDPSIQLPFKGNVDLSKMRQVIETHGTEHIPFVLITVTNNSGGGQPVSLANIRAVSEFCHAHGLRLFIDAARFAENAFFIHEREEGQKERSIADIVKDVFACADGCTMSAKKDGIVSIGGFIALRDEQLYERCTQFNILFEGFITYGGLSGRDMEALAVGLHESIDVQYLAARIGQVHRLADSLTEAGVPIYRPTGGHAVYIDAKRFLPHIPQEMFPAQALVCELYREGGIRGVEVGTVLADRDPVTRKNRPGPLELVRLAIPRRVFSDNHMAYVSEIVIRLWQRRESIRGLRFTFEPEILRHFRARFEWVDPTDGQQHKDA